MKLKPTEVLAPHNLWVEAEGFDEIASRQPKTGPLSQRNTITEEP